MCHVNVTIIAAVVLAVVCGASVRVFISYYRLFLPMICVKPLPVYGIVENQEQHLAYNYLVYLLETTTSMVISTI